LHFRLKNLIYFINLIFSTSSSTRSFIITVIIVAFRCNNWSTDLTFWIHWSFLNCCLSCRNEEILRNLRNELSGACARVHKDEGKNTKMESPDDMKIAFLMLQFLR